MVISIQNFFLKEGTLFNTKMLEENDTVLHGSSFLRKICIPGQPFVWTRRWGKADAKTPKHSPSNGVSKEEGRAISTFPHPVNATAKKGKKGKKEKKVVAIILIITTIIII